MSFISFLLNNERTVSSDLCHGGGLSAQINFHPHLHFLATEGEVDKAGIIHRVHRTDDTRLGEFFTREVLGFLDHKQLLRPESADLLLASVRCR